MLPKIDIENLMLVEAADAASSGEQTKEIAELIQAECDNVSVSGNKLRFHVQWEPPFKILKAWSKEHPETKIILWGDAFAEHHWLLKATIKAGKVDDQTLSRIDDEFDAVFKEVYGCTFEEWEKKPSKPFAAS